MFEHDFSEELNLKIKKLLKKDKKRAEIMYKKIKEIVNNDAETIKRYKNLRHDLSDLKRVHIDTSFVLTFKVDLVNNFILFYDFDHHDVIFKH
ncbi:MAG: addiction module toxin RelE [archaeon]|nr:addiction module toxin RelE [archaeon]